MCVWEGGGCGGGGDGRLFNTAAQCVGNIKLSFGSEIYSSSTKIRLSVLNAVHHAGTRIASRGFRSSPIQSLLGGAGVLRLELIIQSHIIKYWVRARKL